MKTPTLRQFFTAIFILFILSIPQTAAALDLIVDRNSNDPARYATIQAALDYARSQLTGSPPGSSTYRIVVTADPYPYTEPFIPISNVPIIGSETGGTFLGGYFSGNLISLNNVSNVTIKNFTFDSSAIGIAVTNSSSITIANNIFKVGGGNRIALQIQDSPSTTVVNNTFYQNGTALSTNSDSLITNNIFSGNGTAITATTNLSRLTYNTYHNNGTNGAITLDANSLPNSSVTNSDPLFVNPNNNDFHLRSGSPSHIYGGGNAGNPDYPNADNPAFFDMGAYGGPGSDTIPFTITGLKATVGAAADSIVLNWNLNLSYQVTGYHVYYGTANGDRNGTGAAEGNSPLTVSQGVSSATLSNLPLITPVPPPVVTGVTLTPENGSLYVSWNPVPHASGYKVYFSTTSFSASSLPATYRQINNTNTSASSYLLLGLTNGVTYYVAVAAFAQSPYVLTVTALSAGSSVSSVSNESNFAPEVIQYLGTPQEGAVSNVVNAAPAYQPIYIGGWGDITPGPGCFIATAAYGHYSAPQVQVLRDFRDRFLLTNAPGRAFVAWYYRYGPKGAEFITMHSWCKPLVRLLLLPLIGGSLFILHSSLMTKCVVLIGILLLGGTIVRRKKTEKGGIPCE